MHMAFRAELRVRITLLVNKANFDSGVMIYMQCAKAICAPKRVNSSVSSAARETA